MKGVKELNKPEQDERCLMNEMNTQHHLLLPEPFLGILSRMERSC